MSHLSEKEQEDIIRRASGAISQIQEGEDAVSVLSGIYRQNLAEKSPQQGKLMAQALLSWMEKFRSVYDEAMEAPEACLHRHLMQLLAPLPLDAQCDLLRRELGSLGAAELWEGEDSEPIRDKLLNSLCDSLGDEDFFQNIPPLTEKTEYLSRNAAKAILGEDMLLATTAMVIYTMAQKGELSGVPQNMTLAQVTVGVCTEDTLRQLQWLAKKGYQQEQIQKRIRALRVACIAVLLTAAVALTGGTAWILAKGVYQGGILALVGYLLLWLGTVLAIYYKSKAEMIRDEAEEIPYIPVQAYTVQEGAKKNVMQKHLPWPETAQTPEKQEVEAKPKAYSES